MCDALCVSRPSLATAAFLLAAALMSSGCKDLMSMDAFKNVKVEGTFTSTNPELGEWTVAPTSCVDGKERGFEGMAFGFDEGAVKELRVDSALEGHNIVEVHMADKAGTVYRALEPDCETITGSVTRSNVTINDRHMFRLVGNLEFRCSKDGLEGRADFDGCLPQTL